jgi:dTDP-4-dehydrorhamnose reductase
VRILVTGAAGMLGSDVCAVLHGCPHTPLPRAALDLTDAAAVRAAVAGHDVVINAAAWTKVDLAETEEAAATAVNGTAVAHLAAACAGTGAVLLHLSTDYVFAGDATTPYAEDAPTAPRNAYGRGKLAGERAVLALATGYVVRTEWLYGAHGPNFVRTMLRLAAGPDPVSVVNDQRGQPTWSYALAQRLVELAAAASSGTAPPGVYHGTAAGETTWYELARTVFEAAGHDPGRVRPTSTGEFLDRARRGGRVVADRPAYSVLGHDRWAAAGMKPMDDWRDMLRSALPSMLAPAG